MPRIKKQEPINMPEVPVNGKVLQWARTIRGLDVAHAAELLGISTGELLSYESGEKRPLVGFLRNMSSRYQINFTSLLMPEPLPIPERPQDYRVRFGRRALSIETLVAMEEVSEALDIFQDIAAERKRIIPRFAIGKGTLTQDPEQLAARERRKFGISVAQQQEWRDLGEARRRWRERIEKHGVFTYMIPMPYEELSGFSVLRGEVAAVCVNDREPTEGAKTFTLFHEYCHLLLRQAGISDENDSDNVEKFCNKFAASFLIPKDALFELVNDVTLPHEFSDADVRRLAVRFKVSNRAMAFRLEETGFAPTGFYWRRTGPWDVPKEREPKKGKQQPSAIKIRIKRVGHLHASTVLAALAKKVINSFDASELIGLRPSVLPKVEAQLG